MPKIRCAKKKALDFCRGFSMIEYALIIAVAVAALVGMSVYLKRALSGKWRQSMDSFGSGRQYEPGVTVVTEGE